MRYLTLAALGVAGFKMMPGHHRHLILSPAWENLRRLAPGRHNGIGLSRFMSFCSAAGIEPGGVDLAAFLRYRQELENNSLLRKAGFVYRTTCVLWNRASKSISEWPKLEIAVPSASRRYSLDWSAFPASFQADVDAFLTNAGNQDPLADDFAPSVRPATILGRRKQIQQMATAFVGSGAPAATLTGLAILVQADNAKKVLTFFLNRPTVGNEGVYAMAVLLRTIARHWVPLDDENIAKLVKFCKGLTPKKHGMTDKNRSLLRQFDDPRNLDALLALPAKLVRETQRRDAGAKWELQGILYAVAIELLIVAPIRIKNLVLLDIDRHIIQSRRGAQTVIHIVIPGEDVKNGVPFEVVLPKATCELLSLYLKTYRPRISDKPSPWLFPNPAGGPRNIVRFGGHISETISRHTGLKMHPHLFRHLSVKLLLEVHPEGIETARLLLGHKRHQRSSGGVVAL